jgi:hypothetical protein
MDVQKPEIFNMIDKHFLLKLSDNKFMTYITEHIDDLSLIYNDMSVYAYTTRYGNISSLKIIHTAYTNKLVSKDIIPDILPYNIQGPNTGFAAIHYAVTFNLIEQVKYLINEVGVDINTKTNDLDTPLHLACLNGWDKIFKILINTPNININILNKKQQSPLIICIMYNRIYMIKKLLKNNAKIDIDLVKKIIPQNQEVKDLLKKIIKYNETSETNKEKTSEIMMDNKQKQEKLLKREHMELCLDLDKKIEMIDLYRLANKFNIKYINKTKNQLCNEIATKILLYRQNNQIYT